jgi:hypothetical protein
MSLVDRIFRGRKKDGGPPDIAVPALVAELRQAALTLSVRPLAHELVRARLADAFRALALDPMPAADLMASVHALDDEGWRRLALLVAVVEGEAMRGAWPALSPDGTARRTMEQIAQTATEKALLSLDLVRQSEHRAEELARGLVKAVGARVRGETEVESTAHLERLDYARLLGQAEQAKKDAEARMVELRKLQEKMGGAGRRGKW